VNYPTPFPTTTKSPTFRPTNRPTSTPSRPPTNQPTYSPTGQPTGQPSRRPSGQPSSQPTAIPTDQPSGEPSGQPSSHPSSQPSGQPSKYPSYQPSSQPSSQPSGQPSTQPSYQPSSNPTFQPSSQPSGHPSSQPSSRPSWRTNENNLFLFHSVRKRNAIVFNSSEEKYLAFIQFEKNLNKIHTLNSNYETDYLRFGINRFAIFNVSTFRANYFGVVVPKGEKKLEGSDIIQGRPASLANVNIQNIKVDWTGIYTTPIKNQGRCGCCYVFSAISQIESDAMRLNHTSPLLQLSPQQPLDCGGPATALGCGGGFPLNIYAYARRSGLVRSALYPYQGGPTGSCSSSLTPTAPVIVSVLKFYVFQQHNEIDVAVYIQNVGPLAAIVYADKWQHYVGGIMTATACGYTTKVNHAVQIVGIDYSNAAQAYWIVSRLMPFTRGRSADLISLTT